MAETAGGIAVALDALVCDASFSTSAGYRLTGLHIWARRCAIFAIAVTALAIPNDVRRNPAPSAPSPSSAHAAHAESDAEAETGNSERPHYRYSVIAGGAYSAEELASVFRRDAVVAAHHSTVDPLKMRATVTPVARMAYVSYRVGDQVFWTRKPVLIPAGETLLTDGDNEIRARCGNGVSDIAREPVSDVEPLAAELDESSTAGEQALLNAGRLGTPYVPFLLPTENGVLGSGADLPGELGSLGFFGPGAGGFLGAGPAYADSTMLPDGGAPSFRGAPFDTRIDSGAGFLTNGGNTGGTGRGSNADPGGGSTPGDGSNLGNPDGDSTPGGTTPPAYPGSEDIFEDDEPPSVPEPGTLTLLGLGLAAAAAWRRRE